MISAKRCGALVMVGLAWAAFVAPSPAADYYWDVNGVTANGDGGGTFRQSTSGTTWSTSSSGTTPTTFYLATNVGNTSSFQFGFGPSPGNATNAGTATIGNSSSTSNQPTVGALIFNASGTSGYTFQNNSSNSNVMSVTITASATNGIGSGTGILVNSNATGDTSFIRNPANTAGSAGIILGSSQTWTNNSTTYALKVLGPVNVSNAAYGLTTNGPGIIQLGGSSAFGSLTVAAGTVKITDPAAAGPGAVSVAAGATLNVLASLTKNISNSGAILVGPGGVLTASSLGAGSLSLAGDVATSASFTDTLSGTLGIGAVSLGGNSTVSMPVTSRIQSSAAVAITGAGNVLSLSGLAAPGTTYTLLSGASLTNTGSLSLTGAAVGNQSIPLGSSATVGRTTYSFTSTPTALQLVATGSQVSLTWTGATNSTWDYTTSNWTTGAGSTYFGSGDNGTIGTAAAITVQPSGVVGDAITIANASGTVSLTGGSLTATTLVKSNAGAFSFDTAVAAGSVTLNAGSLTVNGTGSLISTTLANNAALIFATTGTQTVAAAMSGTGSLAVSGGGTLILSGSSTWNGAASIAAGSGLKISGVIGSGSSTSAIANDGTLECAAAQGVAGAIGGVGGVVKSGAGTITALSGSNSFTGATTVQSGRLVLGSAWALGTGDAGTTVAAGGSLDLNGQAIAGESLTLSGTGQGGVFPGALVNTDAVNTASWSGPVTLASAQTYVGGDGDTTFAGGFGGSGGLYKMGEGMVTLAAPSSFTGTLFISTGVVQAVDPTTLPNVPLSWNNSNSSAELDLVAAGDYSMASIGQFGSYLRVGTSGTGTVTLSIAGNSGLGGSANKSLDVHERTKVVLNSVTAASAPTSNRNAVFYNSGEVVINGVISGGASGTIGQFGVVQTANALGQSGTLTLNGANAFTGVARVSAGTLKVGNAGAFGSTNAGVTISAVTVTDTTGVVTTLGRGTVDLNGFTIDGETLTMDGTLDRVSLVNSSLATAGTWSAAVATSGTAAFGGAGDLVVSGAISGSGLLVKTGGGTVTLTGSNPFSGSVSIEQGTLAVGAGGTLAVPTLTGGGLLLAGAAGAAATFTDTATSGTMTLGSFTMGGDASLGLTVGIGQNGSLAATGPVSVAGGNNLITLSGIAAIGSSYTLVSGSSLSTTGATLSVTGPAVANQTIGLGQSVTSGRATYSFTKTATALQLTVTGSLLNLVWTGSQGNAWDYTSTNWQSGGAGTTFGPGDDATISTPASIAVDAAGIVSGTVAVTSAGGVDLSGGTLSAAAVSKSGAGTFTLTTNLAVAGGIAVSGGVLQVGSTGALGGGSHSGAIVNNASIIYSGTANQTLAGAISGTGSLTQAGTGTLFLTGTSTATGPIAVAAGSTLKVSDAGVLGSGSFTGGIANDGSFVISSSVTQTLAGAISGSGGITKSGSASAVTLAGANTYTGTTTVGSGTLALGSPTALGSTAAGTVITAGGVLDLNGQTGVAEPLAVASSGIANSGAVINSNTAASASVAGTVTLNDAATGFGGAGTTTLSGLVTGAGGLTKWGEGTLVLAGTANYTGGLTMIQAGTLRLQNPGVLTSGTLQSSNAASSSALDLANSGSYALGFLSLGQSLRINHSGTGPATLTFTAGALTGNIDKVLETGASTTVVIAGGFDMPSGTAAARSVVLGGAGTTVFNGVISGSSALVPSQKFGLVVGGSSTTTVGTTILNAANTYNGDTVVVSGTLRLGTSQALGSTAAGTIVTSSTLASIPGGVLDLYGQTIQGESLTLTGSPRGVSMVNTRTGSAAAWSGPVTASGVASIGGPGAMTISGNLVKVGTGTLTIGDAAVVTGSTTIQGGGVQADSAGALAASRVQPLAGGTLSLAPYLQASLGGLAPLAGGLTDVGSGMITVTAGLPATDMVAALLTGLGDGRGTARVASPRAWPRRAAARGRWVGSTTATAP
ncbi:MAG: beta strand repeat-containing protein [Planctomycetaceae bacterium]